MPKKKSNKKDYGVLVYFISALITLNLHYFFISKININSTIQVAIDFIIVLVLTGIILTTIEEFQNEK